MYREVDGLHETYCKRAELQRYMDTSELLGDLFSSRQTTSRTIWSIQSWLQISLFYDSQASILLFDLRQVRLCH